MGVVVLAPRLESTMKGSGGLEDWGMWSTFSKSLPNEIRI